MRAALAVITDAFEVLSRLLAGGQSTVAGRLAGAFRNIGRDKIADNIIAGMRAAGSTQDLPFSAGRQGRRTLVS